MSRRLEISALTVILCLAAFLRLGWPGLTEFKRDEAQLYTLALDLATGKHLPLRGLGSSVGLPNSPVSVYILALPLLIWKSPLAATLFVGAANTAAVALAYFLARRYLGIRAALVATLLYAAAPWAVIYSRKIWAQNLLPPFVVGYVFSAMLAFVEGRQRWLAVHLVLLALCVQIHFSALALIPLTLTWLVLFRRRVSARMLAGGALMGAVTALPFAWYLVSRLQAGQPAGWEFLNGRILFTADAFELAALVSLGTHTHSLAGPEAFRDFLATAPPLEPLFWLGGVLSLIGTAVSIRRLWANRSVQTIASSARAGLLLVLWLYLPVLVFVPHLSPVYPHYFIILLPAPYLLAGIAVETLAKHRRVIRKQAGLWLAAAAIAAAQTWTVLRLLSFVGVYNTPGGFGLPLERLLEAAAAARRLGSSDILIVAPGDEPGVDEVPAVFEALLHGTPHRFVDGRTTAVFPAGNAVALVWPGDYPAVAAYRQWSGGRWTTEIRLRSGEGIIGLATGMAPPEVPHRRTASALLSNSTEILGSGGNAQLWELWWQVTSAPPSTNYHVFAHLLDSNDKRISQVDEPTLAGRYWHAGDLVVNYFPLCATATVCEANGVAVRAGMYAYPALTTVEVLDAAGNPSGEWLVFPLNRRPAPSPK